LKSSSEKENKLYLASDDETEILMNKTTFQNIYIYKDRLVKAMRSN